MARHRCGSGQSVSPIIEQALQYASARGRVSRRLAAPSSGLKGRVVVAAVAAGAFVTAAHTLNVDQSSASTKVTPLASDQDIPSANQSNGMGGELPVNPEIVPIIAATEQPNDVGNLIRALGVNLSQAESHRAKYVIPAEGVFTSGFGARWGVMHWGIDLANRIGTPIVSVADGVVIEAGPASGFGLWIRIEHDDGTITVYGHIDKILVDEGQRVKAGDEIALMGNRGFSTGPHLHLEVWDPSGKKINPLIWLKQHGVTVH